MQVAILSCSKFLENLIIILYVTDENINGTNVTFLVASLKSVVYFLHFCAKVQKNPLLESFAKRLK